MLLLLLQVEQKEKFLKTALSKPTMKNNFRQLDLETIRVEVTRNISQQIINLFN